MRRNFFYTIIFLMIFLNCSQRDPIAPQNSPSDGQGDLTTNGFYGLLKVTSVPNDAAIFIDKINTGRKAPYSFNKILIGKHLVQVKLDGFISFPDSIKLIVTEGNRIGAHFDLAPF